MRADKASRAFLSSYAEVVESEPIFLAHGCIDFIDDVRGDVATRGSSCHRLLKALHA
jgi:hypothetical protein